MVWNLWRGRRVYYQSHFEFVDIVMGPTSLIHVLITVNVDILQIIFNSPVNVSVIMERCNRGMLYCSAASSNVILSQVTTICHVMSRYVMSCYHQKESRLHF